MPTLEPEPNMQVCIWCRMALHTKCESKDKFHGTCMCICSRGY